VSADQHPEEQLAPAPPAADDRPLPLAPSDAPPATPTPTPATNVAGDMLPQSVHAETPVDAEPASDEAAAEPGEPPADAAADGRPGVPAIAAVRDDLTADALLALLRATFADGRAHYWVACPEALGPISAGLPTDLDDWSEGRVWSAVAEMRWHPSGAARFSALYLGEGDARPEGFQPLSDELRAVPSAEADGLFLWGTRAADGLYGEPRLPRPLDYAGLGATAPEARLPYRLLVGADGQVRFIRLTTLTETG